MKLSDVSLLAALNISQWTARKYDKNASKAVADKYGVYDFVGRYNKSLLPMVQELNDIANEALVMRQAFYANTLPYTYEGVRLLPSRNYFDFVNMMNGHIDVWHATVDRFVSGYSQHVTDAEKLLGPMYVGAEYPKDTEIRDRFKVSLTLSPVPDGKDFFNTLADDMAQNEVRKYVKTMETTERAAMQECWQRLYSMVQKYIERLADTGKSVREDHVQSLLDNTQEMCQLLEKLNMMNDPNLEAMRLEVKESLCMYNATVLSGHELTKQTVREKAEAIMKKMDGYMGVSA